MYDFIYTSNIPITLRIVILAALSVFFFVQMCKFEKYLMITLDNICIERKKNNQIIPYTYKLRQTENQFVAGFFFGLMSYCIFALLIEIRYWKTGIVRNQTIFQIQAMITLEYMVVCGANVSYVLFKFRNYAPRSRHSAFSFLRRNFCIFEGIYTILNIVAGVCLFMPLIGDLDNSVICLSLSKLLYASTAFIVIIMLLQHLEKISNYKIKGRINEEVLTDRITVNSSICLLLVFNGYAYASLYFLEHFEWYYLFFFVPLTYISLKMRKGFNKQLTQGDLIICN